MKNSEVINNHVENNTLIAKFMGAEHWIDSGDIQVYKLNNGNCYSVNNLDYHKSWDWIMPVVSKFNEEPYKEYAEKHFQNADYNYILWVMGCTYVDYDLNGVYKEVVKFIEYYNKEQVKKKNIN